jgi:hypothetical protein
MRCSTHCPKPARGGPGLIGLVIGGLVLFVVVKVCQAVIRATDQAAVQAGRALQVVFEVVMIGAGVLVAVAAAESRITCRAVPVPPHAAGLGPPARRAIGPPRIRLIAVPVRPGKPDPAALPDGRAS